MSPNRHSIRKGLLWAAFAVAALTPALPQEALSLPAWLESYPGASAAVRSSNSLIESSYTVAAPEEGVVGHYRKLFATAGLPFQPNGDGLGTSIRAEARECDLLIQIRSRDEGTFVKVNCAAKSPASTSAPSSATAGSGVQVITGHPQPARAGVNRTLPPAPAPAPLNNTDMMQRHQQLVAELGIHRELHDQPAPPLEWPPWLVDIGGSAVQTQRGVDQAKDAMLTSRYTTRVPMTDLYDFYRDLLNSHEYPARSSMSTGQTITGISQNATGYVEGSNYPDGAPGAYSVIHVAFDRSVLNGPITVRMQFTTHEFNAKRGY